MSKLPRAGLRKLIQKCVDQDDEAERNPTLRRAAPGARAVAGKRRVLTEKQRVMNTYEGLTTPAEFLKRIEENFDKEAPLNHLKNALLSITVVMDNLDKVPREDDNGKVWAKGESLPIPTGDDEFAATSQLYMPQGYRVGREDQFEEFIDANIFKDADTCRNFLKRVYYVHAVHAARLEKQRIEKAEVKINTKTVETTEVKNDDAASDIKVSADQELLDQMTAKIKSLEQESKAQKIRGVDGRSTKLGNVIVQRS